MIAESDVEKAVDFLRDTATEAAQARANRAYMEAYTKSLRAILMREHAELPIAAQEREAMADQRYLDHLQALQIAVEMDERLRWLQTAAETKISCWQSQVKNQPRV